MTMTIEQAIETAAPAKTTADILEHAALIIEERGWTQDQYGIENPETGDFTQQGPHCAVGAIATAYGDHLRYMGSAAEDALKEYLSGENPELDYADGIEVWNDSPNRTEAEVVAALRGAAKAAR